MKTPYILLFVFACFSISMPCKAAVDDGTVISPELMAPLVSWVSSTTKVPIEEQPIATASGRILKTALGLEGVQQARSIAAYLPGHIIINNIIWDPESLRSQSYLVHELVHHTQLLNDRKYPCHAAKEREAYTLQNKWLAEHGVEPIVSQEFIDKVSACGADSDEGDED